MLAQVVEQELPAALARVGPEADALVSSDVLDLVLVAALEVGPHDPEAAALVRSACERLAAVRWAQTTAPPGVPAAAAVLLGTRLTARLHR